MFEDVVDWAESHPFMIAILIFLIFFVGYQVLTKGNQNAQATVAGNGNGLPGAGTNTGTGDTFIDVYQQKPVVGQGPPGPKGQIGRAHV